jgi:glycosyltransferase involved in cell wall biosynthesis
MRVVHLLRKCNPVEWSGTETAVQRLFEGLRQHRVTPIVYCPRLAGRVAADPLIEAGFAVKRFKVWVPVWGIPAERKRQLVAVGGNLLSLDLVVSLWRERDIALIHTHTLGRLGAIASLVARRRRLPLVMTVHGGLLDLPAALRTCLHNPQPDGWEWGKLFGALLRSRQLLDHADAVVTCNGTEAALLREQNPGKRVVVQPHGVTTGLYRKDHRETAREAFPQTQGKRLLLAAGRLDPVKNQSWLIEQAPDIFRRHPDAMIVLAGPCTDEAYGRSLAQQIGRLGLEHGILRTGGWPASDPRLIGLFQLAEAVVLPSVSETFGLVILEAWAAGAPVIASRTSGASALIRNGENGWLFELEKPGTFHDAVDCALLHPALRARLAAAGSGMVSAEYDTTVLAGRMKRLYEELIEEKHALRHSA